MRNQEVEGQSMMRLFSRWLWKFLICLALLKLDAMACALEAPGFLSPVIKIVNVPNLHLLMSILLITVSFF
jgi:hypothetical protein